MDTFPGVLSLDRTEQYGYFSRGAILRQDRTIEMPSLFNWALEQRVGNLVTRKSFSLYLISLVRFDIKRVSCKLFLKGWTQSPPTTKIEIAISFIKGRFAGRLRIGPQRSCDGSCHAAVMSIPCHAVVTQAVMQRQMVACCAGGIGLKIHALWYAYVQYLGRL